MPHLQLLTANDETTTPRIRQAHDDGEFLAQLGAEGSHARQRDVMTGRTYGWFELDRLSGPRFELALEFFEQGRSFIFDGVAFALRDGSVECSVVSSWATPDQQSAAVDLDRAEHVLDEMIASSPEFARRAQGRPRLFLLVEDTGMSTVVLAERRDGTRASQVARAIGAATVALSIPVGLGLYVFFSGPGTDASGRPDNDPYRAAAFLLMLSPVFLAVLSGYFLAVTIILRRLNRLSAVWMLAASLIVSFALGIAFYRQGLAFGGESDAVISVQVIGFGVFLCLTSGSFFWLWRTRRVSV